MRIKNQDIISISFDKELYFSIYHKHKYYPRRDSDYCKICDHSFEIHMEYEVDPEEKELGLGEEKE